MKLSKADLFWRKYCNSILLEQEEQIKIITDKILQICNIKRKDLKKEILSIYLQQYFNDLKEYLELHD